jgi:hypothetical protein
MAWWPVTKINPQKSPNSGSELGDFSEETPPLFSRLQELGKPWKDEKSPNSEGELGDFLEGKYIRCKHLNPHWVGEIETKKIKGHDYYYWRRYITGSRFDKRRKVSEYLGSTSDWEKAIAKLAQKQAKRLES